MSLGRIYALFDSGDVRESSPAKSCKIDKSIPTSPSDKGINDGLDHLAVLCRISASSISIRFRSRSCTSLALLG